MRPKSREETPKEGSEAIALARSLAPPYVDVRRTKCKGDFYCIAEARSGHGSAKDATRESASSPDIKEGAARWTNGPSLREETPKVGYDTSG